MDGYPLRVMANILPLSIANTLPDAFAEWRFTGATVDHETPKAQCELCDQDRLRYHFEIRNDHTGHRLDIGSECILKFRVALYDGARRLTPEEVKAELQEQMRKMRFDSCLRALERLAQSEPNDILANALRYYRLHGKLTPKFANVVFWRLEVHRIDHDPGFFKVRLDRANYVSDLAEMDTYKVHRIWKALSSSQRKTAIANGHPAPSTPDPAGSLASP
jgi:hypothetical protein